MPQKLRGAMHIIEDDLSGAEIRALLELHFEGMLASSPKESCHFLDFDGLKDPSVNFWSIWAGEALAGCGALKMLSHAESGGAGGGESGGAGEVKSMRTAPDWLGHRVGTQMLEHIIAVARARGLVRLSLETGSTPDFDAAHALYQRFGFTYCGPFADYVEDPFSRYMTVEL
jgi:putative acetyltransferase